MILPEVNKSSNRICCQFIALYKTCFAYMSLSSHSSCTCSWPTQWTVTNASCVMSRPEQRASCLSSWSTPIAHAKLKQSQLFERDDIYGIDDALQNRSCPMN